MRIWEKLGLRRSSLVENTILLYILQFSTLALGLLTQGYQVRVMGMEAVGILGAAQYTVNFFQILIDFGFVMSATAKIAQHREDKAYLDRILTCVVLAKCLFSLLSFAILFVIIAPGLGDGRILLAYSLYLLSTVALSLLPDFMYRGLEQMAAITVRAVSIKLFATVMIFVFIHSPQDYWMVPFFMVVGHLGALLLVYRHLYTKIGVRFCRVRFSQVWEEIKTSAQFFFSKAAEAVNVNLNGVILNQVAGPATVGLFTNADKIIAAARNGMSPIADSIYPHMMKHRNFGVIKQALLFVYPVILLGCTGVFVLAKPLLVLWLGPEGEQVVLPLRLLLPVAALTYPNYILGFPTLGAMGLSRHANWSVIFGTGVYLAGAAVCHWTVGLHLVSLCLLATLTELATLSYRIVVIVKNRRLIREGGPDSPR